MRVSVRIGRGRGRVSAGEAEGMEKREERGCTHVDVTFSTISNTPGYWPNEPTEIPLEWQRCV